MIEKQMTKVKGRSESYAIYFGKNDKIDEAKFKKNIVEGDDSKSQVIVMFKDEHDSLIQQREAKEGQIRTLNQRIIQLEEEIAKKSSTNQSSTRELYSKIDDLKKENKKLEKAFEDERSAIHSDHKKELETIQDEYTAKIDELNRELSAKDSEIQDLKLQNEREISEVTKSLLTTHHKKEAAITSDKQKIIDDLKDNISDLKETKSAMTIQHQADVSELKSNYKDTLIRLRTEDSTELSNLKTNLSSVIAELKHLGILAKHTSKYNNLLNELDISIDEFEKTNKNKLLNIDEDIAQIPSNEIKEK